MIKLNDQKITSKEIAEIISKPHSDLMKAIRAMEQAWVKVNQGKFSLVDYTDAKGEKRPMYELSKTECLYYEMKAFSLKIGMNLNKTIFNVVISC